MSLFRSKSKQIDPEPSDAQNITELLYKRNTELATKNKALSLLSHLYEISILALPPSEIARSITDSVRNSLNYEVASIYLFDKEADTLTKVGSSVSDKFKEQLRLSGHSIDKVSITHASTRNFFPVIRDRKSELNQKFGYLLQNVIDKNELDQIRERVGLKSSLVYPLALGDRVLGVFVVVLNRDYNTLAPYEQEIIASMVNVVSLAIDKSLTYQALHVANEKLKDLDMLKTEFLSLAAHQLRSPLTAIRGYTSMLLDGSFGQISDEKQRDAIDRVFQSSTHLSKIVEDLLNVSKIEQGGMKYEMTTFDFAKSVKDVSNDLSVVAEKKGLTLTFSAEEKGDFMLYGDEEKLRQVLVNIIDNAIKYTQVGGITVRLSHSEDGLIKLDVIDTGMGISPEEKEKLFDKFSRGAGGKTNTGGSGLGLYLAKQIVAAHTGYITIDSPGVGKGSTFTIELKGN